MIYVEGDPVGGFRVATAGPAEIGRSIAGLAQGVPALIVHEGGYLLDELGKGAVALQQVATGLPGMAQTPDFYQSPLRYIIGVRRE